MSVEVHPDSKVWLRLRDDAPAVPKEIYLLRVDSEGNQVGDGWGMDTATAAVLGQRLTLVAEGLAT